ncbi:hypothetical protein V1L54_13540 [Streptomyces sp. TRM 70361]|uniref:hypothetical protein n=1 Tax=Streptomyces sp. TRM 70361 TaxID=3116553 RepID=UPI002E7BD3C9|nr:hypothetical protein [Streptomyces sp. TRM 70361]MEE1940416.1 hypothetical protein [Streptomyces sp. TRM 70361]
MTVTRKSLAAAGCALLIAASTACGSAAPADAESRARRAVEKLGEWETVTVTTALDASAGDIRAFARRGLPVPGLPETGTAAGPVDALLLSRAETVLTIGADRPLKDVGDAGDSEHVASALMVNLGGKDLAGYKAIGDGFYVRVHWDRLAAELDWRDDTVNRGAELAAAADELPSSLAAARNLFRGEWVRIDPGEFERFATVAGVRYGEAATRLADGAELLLGARSQHRVFDSVREVLDEHAVFRDGGRRDGAERVTVTLPARETARDLTAALVPLEGDSGGIGAWSRLLDGVPEKGRITLELELRGALSKLTVDLGQFAAGEPDGARGAPGGRGAGKLPLTLTFAPGQAIRVDTPPAAEELEPQDVVGAVFYTELAERRAERQDTREPGESVP